MFGYSISVFSDSHLSTTKHFQCSWQFEYLKTAVNFVKPRGKQIILYKCFPMQLYCNQIPMQSNLVNFLLNFFSKIILTFILCRYFFFFWAICKTRFKVLLRQKKLTKFDNMWTTNSFQQLNGINMVKYVNAHREKWIKNFINCAKGVEPKQIPSPYNSVWKNL